jgi:hypothetical protein
MAGLGAVTMHDVLQRGGKGERREGGKEKVGFECWRPPAGKGVLVRGGGHEV